MLFTYLLTFFRKLRHLQDGTLTDSIAAVEAAWGKVAKDIGQDPEYVIAATHGKRAVDNLSQFKPQLAAHEIEEEVERFEITILYYADAHAIHSGAATPYSINAGSSVVSTRGATPALTPGTSAPPSRRSSVSVHAPGVRRPSFGSRLLNMLNIAAHLRIASGEDSPVDEEDCVLAPVSEEGERKLNEDVLDAWQIEAASVDRSVRILPGVRKMIDSIPEGRYAVATSGAKTYGRSSSLSFHSVF